VNLDLSAPTDRELLARITLAAAPTPQTIRFAQLGFGGPSLSMDLHTIADLRAWMVVFGGSGDAVRPDCDPDDGHTTAVEKFSWRGWYVTLFAAAPAELDDATVAALEDVAAGAGRSARTSPSPREGGTDDPAV
jgi:hypothetical protein